MNDWINKWVYKNVIFIHSLFHYLRKSKLITSEDTWNATVHTNQKNNFCFKICLISALLLLVFMVCIQAKSTAFRIPDHVSILQSMYAFPVIYEA